MAADFDKPTGTDLYTDVLPQLRDNIDLTATMFASGAGSNTPVNAVQFLGGAFALWNGATFNIQAVSVGGGGTGSTTAAGARTNLNVSESGAGSSQTRTNSQNDMVYCALSRQINTAAPLQGGGTLEDNLTLSIQDGTTAQKGAVQLNNTLTSTSTTQALTAAQGKVLGDKITPLESIVGVGYYNEQSLGASGDLTVGSCKVVRIGSVVTITGVFSHSNNSSPDSAIGYIPSWARPVSYAPASNLYTGKDGVFSGLASVTSDGSLGLTYSQVQSQSGVFSLSYVI